jgi:hypothetical protein
MSATQSKTLLSREKLQEYAVAAMTDWVDRQGRHWTFGEGAQTPRCLGMNTRVSSCHG